ncbi:MAG: glycosyltransferase family 10 [Treponema sp.]|nr:glycosyltransferase family 10 [Treponema sp.]
MLKKISSKISNWTLRKFGKTFLFKTNSGCAKVKFSNFWPTVTLDNFDFVNPLKINLNSFFNDNSTRKKRNVKIELFSVFGDKKKIQCSDAKIKIFFTGEEVHKNFTDYDDLCINNVDLSVGFDFEEDINRENYFRYPLWLCYYFGATLDKDEIAKQVVKINSKQQNNRDKFCSLVAAHDLNDIRKNFIQLLRQVDIVSCPGLFMHNDDSLRTVYDDNKIRYLENFVFNLCPENVSVKGYTTEKLFQSFDAGCIPIYSGSANNPEPNVINKDAIVFYNGNDEDFIHEIELLWHDVKYRQEFLSRPRLLDTAVDYIYERTVQLNNRIKELFESKLK